MKKLFTLLVALVALPALAQAPAPALSVADDGAIHLGERTIDQRELYEITGRTDLTERAMKNEGRRTAFVITAVASGLALVGTGVGLLATTPNLASPYCESSVDRYNHECLPQVELHRTLGTALLVSGLVAGTLFATLAYWAKPDLLTRREVEDLVDAYNKKTAPPPAPVEVRLTPLIAPGFGGLSLSLRF